MDDIKHRRLLMEGGEGEFLRRLTRFASCFSNGLSPSLLKHFIKIHMRSIGYRSLDDGQIGAGIQAKF